MEQNQVDTQQVVRQLTKQELYQRELQQAREADKLLQKLRSNPKYRRQ